MKGKARAKRKHGGTKSVLRLPDLELAKSAVLNSLSCPAQRGYRHAMDEFVTGTARNHVWRPPACLLVIWAVSREQSAAGADGPLLCDGGT